MQGVIGKLVFGVVDPFNDAGLAQRRQVGVNAFYVTFDQAGNLADAERTGTSHGFQQVHALRGEYLPEKLVGGEADARGLALAGLEGFGNALLDRRQIGRASCRERVCPSVSISVVAGSLKTKKNK